MRSHGTAVACYRGYRPPTGTCDACRKGNATRNYAANRRFKSTALGMLAIVRAKAKQRGNA